MGQLILGPSLKDGIESKKGCNFLKGLLNLDEKGYLKAHYSANELKNLFASFGNLEQYLVIDDNK